MQTYEGVNAQIHVFLTLALDVGVWSASLPGRFTAEERASAIHWVGDCIGSRVGLNGVENRKSLGLAGNRNCKRCNLK
jgi:hypothetical protein